MFATSIERDEWEHIDGRRLDHCPSSVVQIQFTDAFMILWPSIQEWIYVSTLHSFPRFLYLILIVNLIWPQLTNCILYNKNILFGCIPPFWSTFYIYGTATPRWDCLCLYEQWADLVVNGRKFKVLTHQVDHLRRTFKQQKIY